MADKDQAAARSANLRVQRSQTTSPSSSRDLAQRQVDALEAIALELNLIRQRMERG